jgi:hypothetical protein
MLILTLRTASRGFALALVTLAGIAALSFFADTALAGRVVLSGTYGADQIKTACGSDFVRNGAAYGCSKTAKDGSTTTVECNWDGQCVGSCKSCGPAIAHGKNQVFGVLSGGALKANSGTLKTNTGGAQPVHGPGSNHSPIAAKPIDNHPILERGGSGGKLK